MYNESSGLPDEREGGYHDFYTISNDGMVTVSSSYMSIGEMS